MKDEDAKKWVNIWCRNMVTWATILKSKPSKYVQQNTNRPKYTKMKLFELVKEKEITDADLKQLETYADRLFVIGLRRIFKTQSKRSQK